MPLAVLASNNPKQKTLPDSTACSIAAQRMWLELYPGAQPMTQEKVHAVSWKRVDTARFTDQRFTKGFAARKAPVSSTPFRNSPYVTNPCSSFNRRHLMCQRDLIGISFDLLATQGQSAVQAASASAAVIHTTNLRRKDAVTKLWKAVACWCDCLSSDNDRCSCYVCPAETPNARFGEDPARYQGRAFEHQAWSLGDDD